MDSVESINNDDEGRSRKRPAISMSEESCPSKSAKLQRQMDHHDHAADLEDFLSQCGVELTQPLQEKLVDEYGVEKVADLSLLKEEELREAGLKVIQCRRILRHCKDHLVSPPSTLSNESIPSIADMPSQEEHTTEEQEIVPDSHSCIEEPVPMQCDQTLEEKCIAHFQIHYILCEEMFTCNQEQYTLTIDPMHTMETLIKRICVVHKLPDHLTVELFLHNGSPLNVNCYTMKFTLSQWKIQNDSSLYAFVRVKNQPSWTFPAMNDSGRLDPTEGEVSLKILCEVYGAITVNVNPSNLRVKTVLRKVSTAISVPSQCLALYESISKGTALGNDEELHVDNCNEPLIVRLINAPQVEGYVGKSSYIPVVPQTDKGLAKFYCILNYVMSSFGQGQFSCLKMATVVMKLTSCPPISTAFYSALMSRKISFLPTIVAIFEGLYHLSRAVLQYFCSVDVDKTFEFADYIFGLILKLVQSTSNNCMISVKDIHLSCLISCQRVIEPVTVGCNLVYEKSVAVRKVENNEKLKLCTIPNVTKDMLLPSDELEHCLMCCAFSTVKSVPVCRDAPESDLSLPSIPVPCNWNELKNSVKVLNIRSPNETGQMCRSIIYIKEGQITQFALSIGLVKSVDLPNKVYNPITGKEILYSKEQLKQCVCSDITEVVHNLVDFLKPEVKQQLTWDDLQSIESDTVLAKMIYKKPLEAIVVLIDTSASMDLPVFNDDPEFDGDPEPDSPDDQYKRITAAEDFVLAFINRTLAYEMTHAVGAIAFGEETEEIAPLSTDLLNFKSIIGEVEIEVDGQTALYEALKKAAEALATFGSAHPSCRKRILCLTDGEDNCSRMSSYKIANTLRSMDIVVDTVLITGPRGNDRMKGISHATGGLCLLPTTCSEGMRVFEMEILLSVRQRSNQRKPVLFNQYMLKRLENGEYDSTDPFDHKSNFFLGLDDITTCSAKRMVQLAFCVNDELTNSSDQQQPHVKRIMKELLYYDRNPHEDIAVFPNESNVCHWKILMRGPKGTPYEGGVYLLFAKFSQDYPNKPLEIRFVTPIYHCNINSVGRICHPILGRRYVSSLSVKEIFEYIYGLLMAPEPDDPLDSILANEFHTDKEEYLSKAQELTCLKAIQITWDEYVKALSEENADICDELKCPLTGKVFIDPVSTPYGHTYERSALLQYMTDNNNMDPQARQPLTEADLRPCEDIKAQLADIL